MTESQPAWYNPPKTIRAVLCYIESDSRYLLLHKASGRFGGGFWNAPGGKIEQAESAEQAVVREVREETGLSVSELKYAGFLEFYFGSGKKTPDWVASVYTTSSFTGNLIESEEGKLRWFSKQSIPYEEMWEDDKHWLPILISGKRFKGSFEFSQDGKKIVDYKVETLN